MMSEKRRIGISYAAVLTGAVVLYTVSCAPGVLWQDSGTIQYRVVHNDMEGKLGLALSHPLFYVLAIGAKYIPIGQVAYRVNLVSAIAGAVAVANMFLLVRLWLGKNLPALIAAMSLALSHTFWRHASMAETYSLYAALFLAGLIMLLQYVRTGRVVYLYLVGLFNGLAIAVHMLASIPLVCYGVFLAVLLSKRAIRMRELAVVIVFWIIGAGLYECLIIKSIIETGDVGSTLASAAFGTRYQGEVLNTSLSVRMVKENFLYIFLNFPTPNIVLFVAGCVALFKLSLSRGFRNVLLGILILFFLFAFRYKVVDRYVFFIPFYCMVSLLIGVGAYFLGRRINRRAFLYVALLLTVLPVPVYAVVPRLAEKMHFSIGTKREIPYRDDYKYFLQPWKTGYDGASRFADEALDGVEENALIYADGTTACPLFYAQQVKGKRQDVRIVSEHDSSENAPALNEDTVADLVNSKALYVTLPVKYYCPDFLLERYDFVESGVLWRVVERK